MVAIPSGTCIIAFMDRNLFIADQCPNDVCSFEFMSWFIDDFQLEMLTRNNDFVLSDDALIDAAEDYLNLSMAK